MGTEPVGDLHKWIRDKRRSVGPRDTGWFPDHRRAVSSVCGSRPVASAFLGRLLLTSGAKEHEAQCPPAPSAAPCLLSPRVYMLQALSHFFYLDSCFCHSAPPSRALATWEPREAWGEHLYFPMALCVHSITPQSTSWGHGSFAQQFFPSVREPLVLICLIKPTDAPLLKAAPGRREQDLPPAPSVHGASPATSGTPRVRYSFWAAWDLSLDKFTELES